MDFDVEGGESRKGSLRANLERASDGRLYESWGIERGCFLDGLRELFGLPTS